MADYTPEQIMRRVQELRRRGDSAKAARLEKFLMEPSGTVLRGSVPFNPANLSPILAAMNISGANPIAGLMPSIDIPVPGAVEAGAVSAGRTADRLMQERIAPESGEAMAALEEEYPVATAVGGALPYMAVPVGGASRAVGGALTRAGATTAGRQLGGSMLADAVLTGAGLGALDTESSAAGGAAGGALGYGAGQLLSRPFGMLTNRLTGAEARNVARARELGLEMTPGEATGSYGARMVEAGLRSTPGLSGGVRKVAERRQDVMNRIAAEAIGESADDVSEEVLGRAATRIGKEFDAVRDSLGDIPLSSQQLVDEVKSIANEFTATPALRGLENRFIKTIDVPGKRVRGKDLMTLSSDLGKVAAGKGDTTTRLAAGEIKDMLDDVIVRNLDDEMAARLSTARRQWKSLVQVEAATDSATGNISGPKLANFLERKDVWGFRRGTNDTPLYDMARVARQFKDFPNSWTATRLAPILAAGGLVGGATYGSDADLAAGAGTGAALLLGSRAYPYAGDLLQRWAMSPQARELLGGVGGRIGAGLSAN